jgi:type II secretory ATPase GspE/PulE/Tfp pilus assembly ATPase PilB-like protein
VKRFLGKAHGLFLMSSPPRHGLTTSQYAVIRSHDAYMNNIHALERRKLLDLDNVTQQVYEGNNADVNYARMLQSVLRREPDIVLVGDCEDRETAKIATRAAATDRKIYLGMQAKDTFDAISKYLTLVEDNALAAKALLGISNQRLVRLLCKDCREAFQPDAATLKKLNLPAEKIERFYRPPTEPKLNKRGKEIVCPTCQGTGYVGRTGIFEVLVVDPAVAKLIAEGATVDKIKAQCRKNKMYYLQEEALLKVIDGTTSMNEVLRCLGGGEK